MQPFCPEAVLLRLSNNRTFKYFYLSQINSFKAHILRYNQSLLCLFLLKQYSFLYISPRRRLDTHQRCLHPNAVLARDFSLEPFVYYMWGCFPPPLYDFDGAFCPHFLCSDFIVILFRCQILKNRGRKMEPFLNSGGRFSPPNSESGGTFCPHSGNVAKILFRFIIHTKWKLSISPLR